MRRVILESPLESGDDEHKRYARDCLIDCLLRGEAAFTPRLHYARLLDHAVRGEQELCLHAARSWIAQADALVLYVDYGVCPRMREATVAAEKAGVRVEVRSLRGCLPCENDELMESAT